MVIDIDLTVFAVQNNGTELQESHIETKQKCLVADRLKDACAAMPLSKLEYSRGGVEVAGAPMFS